MVRGLVHTITIKRRSKSGTSYGTVSTTETVLGTGIKCRFTTHGGNADEENVGYTALRQYKIISEPLSFDVTIGDIIVYNNEEYKIAWHKKQINEIGVYHHHSFIVEKADNG